MPKARQKPTTPIAPTPPEPTPESIVVTSVPETNNLPIIYPTLQIDEYSTTSAKGPCDAEWCIKALGWETEPQYQARMVREVPNSQPTHWLFGNVYHCKNLAGEKVRCNYNAHNRPFDEEWCESLVHTVLYGQWAGPHTIPGETINGETIRISKYGRVLSGQHQMSACVLADEFLHKVRADIGMDQANKKYPAWSRHNNCFIETIVIKGMSEDSRVLMTVDYVKPRSAADVFYTSEVFRDAVIPDRKEMCKVLAVASDTLWTRTDTRGYRTHPEMVAFLDRHKRLLDCVSLVFKQNTLTAGRKLQKLHLVPGVCAALAFIQGSSGPETDGDVYRNEEPPTQKNLDWSLWERAAEFWSLITTGRDLVQVRVALARLAASHASNPNNRGLGGNTAEKLALLAKAWEVYKEEGASFCDADLEKSGVLALNYGTLDDQGHQLPDGEIKLLDVADFCGIDCPSGATGQTRTHQPPDPVLTREEIERAMEEARARRQTAAR